METRDEGQVAKQQPTEVVSDRLRISMGRSSPFRIKRAMAKLLRAQKSPTRQLEVRVGQDGKYV
jgi:hypothetical protein